MRTCAWAHVCGQTTYAAGSGGRVGVEGFDEEAGPAGDGLGIGAGDRVAAAFERRELHGEVADGGAFGRSAIDLELGGLCGEAVEEGVLVGAADDEEPL